MKIHVETPGIGRGRNPYALSKCKHWNAKQPDTYCAVDDNECNCALLDSFDHAHPLIPAIYPNGTPLPVGEWEVTEKYRVAYFDPVFVKYYPWEICTQEFALSINDSTTKIENIYIATSPTPDVQPVKALEGEKYWHSCDKRFKDLHQDLDNIVKKYGYKDFAFAVLTYQKTETDSNYKLLRSWI